MIPRVLPVRWRLYCLEQGDPSFHRLEGTHPKTLATVFHENVGAVCHPADHLGVMVD